MSETRPDLADRDVFVTRSFKAPRDVVWRFWTEPTLLVTWFGPAGVSVPIDSVIVELRAGGRWELSMIDSTSGAVNPIRGRISSFLAPEFLEIQMNADTSAGPVEGVLLRLTFHDHGNLTRVSLHQGPFSEEIRDMTIAGWELSFNKLELLIERLSA
ncbi:SRPBCC domain-containing protein [Arthrobacter sp. UYEF3]|uniref:SRPBCC family protein n=1 Tax=Arthrobacter sp. UYEF3 TaxID=1756365 RepID=UPI0033919CD2